MVTTTIQFSPEFLVESLKRYRLQHRGRLAVFGVKLVALLVFGPIAVLLALTGHAGAGAGLAAFSLFVFFAHHLDFWWAKHSFLKSPYLNDVLVIEFSEVGFHARSPKQDVKLQWSVFTKVVHFKDGFLLFQGPKVVNWIPFSAFENSEQVSELDQLIRQKIQEHKVVGQ